MDSYVIGKLHDDVWFCRILNNLKLMYFTMSVVLFPRHQPITNAPRPPNANAQNTKTFAY